MYDSTQDNGFDAYLRRRYTLRGIWSLDEERPLEISAITAPVSASIPPGEIEAIVAEVCHWIDRHALHDWAAEHWPVPDASLQHGTAVIDRGHVERLRDELRRRALGLPDPDRQTTIIALDQALATCPDGDVDGAFEYGWQA